MTAHPVPTIDIAPFVRGSEDRRDSVARAVDQACTGFFAITGHGVCDELVAQLRGSAVDFFALPEADKRTVERPEDHISRGWNAIGDRALTYSLGNETPPDLQESFATGLSRCPTHPTSPADGREPSSPPTCGHRRRPNSVKSWNATTA